MSASLFVLVDDKHVPLFRILWVSDVPHFCGNEDCQCEGDYEIRLEQGESVWANMTERDEMLERLEAWHGDADVPEAGMTMFATTDGDPELAQAGGPQGDRLPDALGAARSTAGEALGSL